jgi:triosephosphate isomerase
VQRALENYPMELGAQDMFWEDDGAYTGEISPVQLQELGVSIVMLGHSERRLMFGETDEALNKKILAAMRHGIAPLLCVGETASERDAGQTVEVLYRQLSIALRGVPADFMDRLMILYEPRWAIGQKDAAPPEYIEKSHARVRGILVDIFDARTANRARVVYGGSVNLSNLIDILNLSQVDGAAISRAAWDPIDFAKMVRLAEPIARTKRELEVD